MESIREVDFYQECSPLHNSLQRKLGFIQKKEEAATKFKYRSLSERYIPKKTTVDNSDGDGQEGVYFSKEIHCEGDKILQTIFHYLDKVYRSPQQKEFHMMFTAASLRQIYGDDFHKHRHRVMREYGFSSFKQLVLLCCPRRFGKTFSVSIWSFVMAICVPNTEISIFSPGKRQSVALMKHISTFVDKFDESDRIIQRNEEKMVLRCLDGRTSTINAYPSAVKTLKGVSGSILILEEMAVIDEEVVHQVITPLLQLDNTCMVGISTITGEYNYMSQYLKAKDKNGEFLFHSRHFYLACKACIDAGKAATCNHNSFLLPAWSSARKRKTINALMQGKEALLNQEIGGIASNVNQRAFSNSIVTRLFQQKPYYINTNDYYNQLFIAIDPNGAGKNSDFAITTILRIEGKYIIVGMESFSSKSAAENHGLILAHVRRIEEKNHFRNSLKVFILESNLGLESEHINKMLKDQGMRNYLVMKEKETNTRIGFLTTHNLKLLAVELLREKLADNAIKLVDPVDMINVSDTPTNVIKMLETQLNDFQEVVRTQKGNMAGPKKFYSGKSAGKDDLIMTLLLNVYWSGIFYVDERYANYLY